MTNKQLIDSAVDSARKLGVHQSITIEVDGHTVVFTKMRSGYVQMHHPDECVWEMRPVPTLDAITD